MSDKTRWEERYKSNDTPWHTGRPDFHLAEFIEKNSINPCNALEIGCGRGTNSIWLCQKGFTVTGTDISKIAIDQAKENARIEDLKCNFISADFLEHKIPGAPFDFLFDRGCFHSFNTDQEKARFAKNTADYLNPDGLWFSQCGSADDPPRDTGPPRLKAIDIVKAVEPFFEILSLKGGHFDSNHSKPPRSWLCVLKKRV